MEMSEAAHCRASQRAIPINRCARQRVTLTICRNKDRATPGHIDVPGSMSHMPCATTWNVRCLGMHMRGTDYNSCARWRCAMAAVLRDHVRAMPFQPLHMPCQ
ncbi:hypothetical protein HAX54_035321 [Datura stramonium]|uniref:Uncharacterized protein n=1 Tax=Datura stramonium TaxID=4076 RepID=A0ABS8VHU6_DATST|nr:hypothetical protein [Datura stramonium]